MKFIYEFIHSGISVSSNPIINIFILSIFNWIAYKIALRESSNSIEHWSTRILILMLISGVYVAVVNFIKFIIAFWPWILFTLIILVSIGILVLYQTIHKGSEEN